MTKKTDKTTTTTTTAKAKKPRVVKAPSAPAVVMVTTAKTDKSVTRVDAAQAARVTASDVVNAGTTLATLCLNLLADNLDDAILAASRKRGGISKLFGGKISEADKNALKRILEVNAEKRCMAWASHVADSKRVRCISLQAVAKAIAKMDGEKGESRASLREALAAWCSNEDNDPRELPESLFDLFCDYEVIVTDEPAE